ncbi:3-oxoacyl-ACP synthase, partial [Mesorhizobium sp. M00.F.Ca.ET.149.01.1.1]
MCEKRIAHLAAGAIVESFDNFPEARGQTALILCIGEEGRPGHPVRNPANLLRRIADIVEVDAYSRSRDVAYGRPSGHVALEQARRLISTGEMPSVM